MLVPFTKLYFITKKDSYPRSKYSFFSDSEKYCEGKVRKCLLDYKFNKVQLYCHENSDFKNKDEVPLALWGSQLSLIATLKGYNRKLVIKDKPQA